MCVVSRSFRGCVDSVDASASTSDVPPVLSSVSV